MTSPATRNTLGISGRYRDPVWDVEIGLTSVEQALLRRWWVRRLAFVCHAGAAMVGTVQTYSRLEHSLGLLSLVAHYAPSDGTARIAALLHDVGHLPLSHTFEGVAGLDHHDLGRARVADMRDVLESYGYSVDEIVEVAEGRRASVLKSRPGVLKLDHLDSLVRSGRAHGRLRSDPRDLLSKLGLDGGSVSTDAATARVLRRLAEEEASLHRSEIEVVAKGVARWIAAQLLEGADTARIAQLAEATDDEFWFLALNEPRTRQITVRLRRDPASWQVIAQAVAASGDLIFRERRRYLDQPLVDGQELPTGLASDDHPAVFVIRDR